MTRSWNENWSLRRVPRPDRDGGVKKPSRAKPRTCATVNPSSLATSRDVYPFIPYWLLAPGTSHFALGDGSRFRRLALDPLRRFPLALRPFRLGTHRDEVLLAARRVLPHRHALRLLEGLRQQPIGAVPALVGAEEVRFLDDLPVHLLLGHELRDLDRVGGLLFEGLQLLRLEDHVLPLRELVALHHLVLFDLVAVLGADVLLLQTRAVLLVQPVEADRGRRLAGGEHLDRNGNEAEGQGGGTKRVCAHGLRFHPNACKTEARARSPQYLPSQAVPGPHAGAGRPSGDRGPPPVRGRPLRGPYARRPAAPLGPASRDGWRAQVLGGPEGPLAQPGGQAARGPRRRPPARVRRFRGNHPRRELWRRRGNRVGPRALGAARGSRGGDEKGEAVVRATGLQAQGQVDPREAQEGREGVAAHQGEGRLRVGGQRAAAGVGAIRTHGRGAQGGEGPGGAGLEGARASQGAAPRRDGRRGGADARRDA